MKLLISLLMSSFLLWSCKTDDGDKDKTRNISKESSVETWVSVKDGPTKNILTIHYNVWINGQSIKQGELKDSIPLLGSTVEEIPDTASEDENATKPVTVPKHYDLYLTVK